MKLSAEQIEANWNKFIGFIDTYISEPRASKLKAFYEKYAERIALMPASHKKEYHNAFPGGYVEHVIRVVEGAIEMDAVWRKFDVYDTYTTEELVFSALNHDLGKMGDEEHESYVPQTDAWRRDKLGEEYKHSDRIEYMPVPDRGLYLLNKHGIEYSKNEFLAIKTHDGLYDESNKAYLISWAPETKPRTSLLFIVHQADLMAARIEWEREWLPRLTGSLPPQEKNITVKSQPYSKKSIQTKALGNIKSDGLQSAMNGFFK